MGARIAVVVLGLMLAGLLALFFHQQRAYRRELVVLRDEVAQSADRLRMAEQDGAAGRQDLKGKLRDVTGEMAGLRAALGTTGRTISETSSGLSALSKRTAAVETALGQQATVGRSVAGLRGDLSALGKEVLAVARDLKSLSGKFSRVEAGAERTARGLTELQKSTSREFGRLRRDGADVRRRTAMLERQPVRSGSGGDDSAVKDVRGRVAALSRHLGDLARRLDGVALRAQRIEDGAARLTSEQKTLAGRTSGLEDRTVTLEGRTSTLEGAASKVLTDLPGRVTAILRELLSSQSGGLVEWEATER